MRVSDHAEPIRVRWYPATSKPVGVGLDFCEYASSDWDDESTDQNPALGEQGGVRDPYIDWRRCVPSPWSSLPLHWSTNLTGNFDVPWTGGSIRNFWNTNFLVGTLDRDAYPSWGCHNHALLFRNVVWYLDPGGGFLGQVLAKITFRPEGKIGVARYSFPSLDPIPLTYVIALSGQENPGVDGTLTLNSKLSVFPPGSGGGDWSTLQWVVNGYGV